MNLEVGEAVEGVVHWVSDDEVLLSRGCRLLRSRDGGASWSQVLEIPVGPRYRISGWCKPLRRLFRGGVYHVTRLGDRLIIFGNGRIYPMDLSTGALAADPQEIVGSRPLFSTSDQLGNIFYGEYRANHDRSPVSVLTSADGGETWGRAWTFDSVRHVHGVFWDPWEEAVWVTTGDEDEESVIWRTTNGFGSLQPILFGSQQTRAIQLLFTEEAVFFGSDTPREANWLYRLDRADHRVERLTVVNGSVFYGMITAECLLFSTACEPSDVNRQQRASVWAAADGLGWSDVLSFPKDGLGSRLFQYGQVRFPCGPGLRSGGWLSPYATQFDQKSFRFITHPSCPR